MDADYFNVINTASMQATNTWGRRKRAIVTQLFAILLCINIGTPDAHQQAGPNNGYWPNSNDYGHEGASGSEYPSNQRSGQYYNTQQYGYSRANNFAVETSAAAPNSRESAPYYPYTNENQLADDHDYYLAGYGSGGDEFAESPSGYSNIIGQDERQNDEASIYHNSPSQYYKRQQYEHEPPQHIDSVNPPPPPPPTTDDDDVYSGNPYYNDYDPYDAYDQYQHYEMPPPPPPPTPDTTNSEALTEEPPELFNDYSYETFSGEQIAPDFNGTSAGINSAGGNNNEGQGNMLFGSDLSQVDKDYIFEGLKKLYKKKVLPLEMASKYSHFGSPPLGPSDFEAKPMVLILGQYSVGKTSFIRSLVRQDFPGQRIGPEPTTDRFTAIMHTSEGQDAGRLIPGHALVMQNDKPFRGLASFGNNFLSKFEGAEVSASILRNITIVDTPGVLAGEKQRIGRDYDFGEVIKWFAERADMIIIMFDAHKLDISDELKSVLDVLKPHQDKIRVLLNKADTIDAQQLLRVYGALMWSLGKVVQTPEVCRVYLGSFWEAPLRRQDNRALLEREKQDLLSEMMELPQNAVVRRINELVKRARSVKVHAYIIHYLKKQMPYMIGKSEKQKKLLDRLDREFLACARRYNLPLGDFPNVEQYRKMLREVKDISDFKRLDKNLVYEMDKVMTHDIPMLLQKATSSAAGARRRASPVQQQGPPMGAPDGYWQGGQDPRLVQGYEHQVDPQKSKKKGLSGWLRW